MEKWNAYLTLFIDVNPAIQSIKLSVFTRVLVSLTFCLSQLGILNGLWDAHFSWI